MSALKCTLSLATLLALGLSSASYASDASHGFDRHIVGLFVGATRTDVPKIDDHGHEVHGEEESETETSFGIEYEFRFTKHVSAGLTYEETPDGHHDAGVSLALINLYYRPDSHWRLGAGVGEEEIDGEHGKTETVSRVGVAYDFHVGGFGIAPTVNVDFVDDKTATVAGIVFSKSF